MKARTRENSEMLCEEDLTFQEEYVLNLKANAKRSIKRGMCLKTAFLFGLLMVPLGPIGIYFGGVLGGIIGWSIGYAIEIKRRRKVICDADSFLKRLTYLIRWARFNFSTADDHLHMLTTVLREFHPLMSVQETLTDNTANTQLNRLYNFIKREDVQHWLWIYIDNFFSSIKNKNLSEKDMRNAINEFKMVTETAVKCCENYTKPAAIARLVVMMEDERVVRILTYNQNQLLNSQNTGGAGEQTTRNAELLVAGDQYRRLSTFVLPERSIGPVSNFPDSKTIPIREEDDDDDDDEDDDDVKTEASTLIPATKSKVKTAVAPLPIKKRN
eukprot:GHVL01040086.1.p1 GENE.GHVL01040086.1~~GHVL01040086.1.p1  ORF type:complete len:328 (+),score=56.86 GHVL01040086.1:45-1028(+)